VSNSQLLHSEGADDDDIDARLLAAAAGADQRAFTQLVARHYQVVYRVVWRMMNGHADAQDVTQETFLRLWNNPGQLREAKALRGWLMRVATNLVMDRHRKKPLAAIDAADEIADDAPLAHQSLDRSRVASRIDAAIATLPDRQKLALSLVQFEHMSNIAAAETMGLSVDALESLLARARRALKDNLANEWREMIATMAG
jgi:RNA polymerase sigma-70 factor, ECF subfamily